MDADLWWVMVGVWVVAAVLSGLWMWRHGHSPWWLLVALVLGPLFVPIALERAGQAPRVAVPEDPHPTPQGGAGRRILVGWDGSARCEADVLAALRVCALRADRVVLAEVVSHDDADDEAALGAARVRLGAAAERVAALVPAGAVGCELLSGAPAEALRQVAADQRADLLVVGHHGHGMSGALLGSVPAALVRDCAVPVLVAAGPATAGDGGPR